MPARPPASALALPGRATLAALLVASSLVAACQQRVERTWPTGNPRSEGRVSRLDEREQGLWTYWFPDGGMREQGRAENGIRVGLWKQWHSNGVERSEGSRVWDESTHASPREGAWRMWYENGQLEGAGSFVHGAREGHWDYFLTNGELDGDRTGEYHADQRVH